MNSFTTDQFNADRPTDRQGCPRADRRIREPTGTRAPDRRPRRWQRSSASLLPRPADAAGPTSRGRRNRTAASGAALETLEAPRAVGSVPDDRTGNVTPARQGCRMNAAQLAGIPPGQLRYRRRVAIDRLVA